MNAGDSDRAFSGSIANIYERCLVPLIFEPYAADLAARVAMRGPTSLLEIAAGTGVLTRHLARVLPAGVTITATDLNQSMLDEAATVGTHRPVAWQHADALQLPFPDHSFDMAVCQFGVMFFPDKPRAFSEARRVLRPGGALLFSVWDRIEYNEFASAVTEALAVFFPDDAPRFLERVPHGYADGSVIARDLALGGFPRPADFMTVTERSRAISPHLAALAYCQGTPLRNEIEARGPARLGDATAAAAAAIGRRFGTGSIDGRIQAHVVSVDG